MTKAGPLPAPDSELFKDLLLLRVDHELRAPVAVILAAVDVLRERVRPEERAVLERLASGADRLRWRIEELLALRELCGTGDAR